MIKRPGFVLAILAGLNLLNYVDRTVLANGNWAVLALTLHIELAGILLHYKRKG